MKGVLGAHVQPMSPCSVPSVIAQASTTVVDGTTVVYDERNHSMLIMNASAGSVWTACDGIRPLTEIAAGLAAAHLAPIDVVWADVWATVNRLVDAGLLAMSASDD